jgi:mannose-6-phosphate isomerase-like protein (cupin superfamily)
MRTQFTIFGDPVQFLVLSKQIGGSFSIGRRTCVPGGGTPPHIHENEDEVFSVISGRFEIFDGESWTETPENDVIFAPRQRIHCFRNCGQSEGTIQFTCTGNAFDVFLEGISRYTMPDDMEAIVDYSAIFGIFYPTLPPPSKSMQGV